MTDINICHSHSCHPTEAAPTREPAPEPSPDPEPETRERRAPEIRDPAFAPVEKSGQQPTRRAAR
ncbi:hypothetical protein GCM10010285_17050 [Streptomyces pseudogriseolus]|uniref:Uncharacterized protein n=1 Tax=Streptomyces pseudogriseolus TaxID=36817 RepID=A0ABQ2SUB5_STREZ|nr:hypothetical protein GCM10010285_17050 [Streptomyces rubiginosus]